MNKRFLASGLGTGAFASAGAFLLFATPQPALAASMGDGDNLPPPYIELTGTVRDFRERTHELGHPDFEVVPAHGYGHYTQNVSPTLGEDRKPVFIGGGRKVSSQFKDSQNRPICYTLYNPGLGDTAGSYKSGYTDTGGIQSAESFHSWFHDELGTNMSVSKQLTLTFYLQEDGSYVFDDKTDPYYSTLGGFFPIEHEMFGNPGGSPDRNFHFTFELHTQFTYSADGAQVFQFIGDDDVWVYINGQLVIDLGGVHAATAQYVDLNRLGLTDGETYDLDFFFAERHRTQSNFRVVTNLVLESEPTVATISPAFD